MKKTCFFLMTIVLATATLQSQEHEQDRLKQSGEVLSEILNIPDGVPKYWLDRAECVVIFPSVKKFAIGVGGSYGRGAMSCRSGASFTGAWGPPSMYALEGGNIGFQLGGQATDFVLLVVNTKGVSSILRSKVKLGGEARRLQLDRRVAMLRRLRTPPCTPKSLPIHDHVDYLPESLWKVPPCARTTERMKKSTAVRSRPAKLCCSTW